MLQVIEFTNKNAQIDELHSFVIIAENELDAIIIAESHFRHEKI